MCQHDLAARDDRDPSQNSATAGEEGREGDRQGGPDRGWDQWWLGWHTAGLLDRLYSVLFKPPPIQFHLEKPAWAKSTITGFLAGVM